MLLNNQLKQRIGTLDSGKVLCVALARAIVGRPRVLLLDAPMDRMDLPNARIARAAIIRAAEAVAAVIITSRDAGTLSGVSSRNVFMSDGQLLSTSDSMPKERPVTRVAERQH
jgi:ABC-type sugar transport system ATPase subunit